MKKTLQLLLIFLAPVLGQAQTLQASIGAGSAGNKIKIYVKSSVAIGSTNISTLQFSLAFPETISPQPTATIVPNNTNFPGVTWQVNTRIEGGYFNINITTPSAPIIVNTLNTTNELEVMEVTFTGGPASVRDVLLITLIDGGTTSNVIFLSSGTPQSDGSNLYYNRAGTTVNNQPSYDLINGDPGTGNSTATISGILLPVKFLSFLVEKNGDDAKLNWTSENENQNQFYEAERSTDGRIFNTVNKVNALNNGRTVNSYQVTDAGLSQLNAAIVYYRIKQTDANGTFVYTPVRSVQVNGKKYISGIYPNPAVTTTRLMIESPLAGNVVIAVRDAAGKLVQSIIKMLVKGSNQQLINVSTLAAGEYKVSITGGQINDAIKFTKAK